MHHRENPKMTSLDDQTCPEGNMFSMVEESNYFNQESEVSEFFSGRKILITGGSGFLGRLILEKLLRSCPKIERIYLFMRGKKQKDMQTRFKEYFNDIVFDRLREEQKDVEKKIVLIESDMNELNLGMSERDSERIKDTEVIFHCAASVRFNETLRFIINVNVRATRDLLLLAREMPNLKVFTYVSTAYSQCIYERIEEKFYIPPFKTEDIIKLTEILNDDQLNFITPELLGKCPNTYTYSKAICEDTVRQYSRGLPTCIVRPSSVLAAEKDPIAGWINNFYGLTGVAIGVGLGIIRVMNINKELFHDIIPADYVVNNIIVSTWDTAKKGSISPVITNFDKDDESLTVDAEEIPIYNIVSSVQNPVDWNYCILKLLEVASNMPFSKCLWYPFFLGLKNEYFVYLSIILLHWIPGLIVDSLAFLVGRKPRLLNIYRKLHKLTNVMNFFTTHQWEFSNDNVSKLWNKLSVVDKNKFFFNISDLDWDSYFLSYGKGARVFLLNDPLETINDAKIFHKRLRIIHYTTGIVLLILLLWGLYLLLKFLYASLLSF
ncbi:fatty acyl-CoA reductase wat-like isoform X1 [Vespa velutina]|uniref:fatty acyl-CoA reductase wat-like isoform X1 n=2 Tax=Vespa velutina TaxID=202808 RepID=UPI001FB4C923|nr:fatty acyl-CoA reductase wat-like isoform X1 [Vespa velutina]